MADNDNDDDINDIWEKSAKDENKNPGKKKSSKEDLLKAAARQQLNEGFGIMGEFTGQAENDPAREDDDTGEEPGEDDDDAKKELHAENEKLGLSQMEEESLKEINPKDLQEKSFEFEDGSSKLKAVLAVIAICLLLAFGYFFFFTGGEGQPRVLLSSEPISEENYQRFSSEPGTFKLGSKIFVFFATGGRIGVDVIHFKILEEIKKPGNKTERVLIGQAQRTVKPNWRGGISTHFQRQYFDHPGRYIVQILSPGGQLMAENYLVIK